MADEIRQKIVLEGEKEYSAALKEANRNLKTLRSELKAETAELGANATAQQKAETKGRNLQKQIEQQKKIVDTYQAALKEVKERYGDNSDEVAKWEQKLNNARYTLATMNNDLERSQQDLKKQEDALKSAGNAYDDAADAAGAFGDATDSAGQIADAVTFQSVMTAADNLTSRLTNALNFIKDVGKAAWDWMSDSGEWADELETDSTKWGVDKETLQGWRYAARFIDTDVETIAGGFAKLTGRTDAVNKKLAELGIVADKGVEASEVFWQVIDVMHAMDQAGDTAGLEDVAKNVFGKSYQEMLPLIKAGRGEWEKYVQEAHDAGYILTDEQVDKLTKFDDANQRLQASWESFQRTMASELAPAFESIAGTLTKLIDSFTEWSKTEDGQKSLQGLGDAIKAIADNIGNVEFSSLVGAAQTAIEGLTGALTWITDNWQTVEMGFKAVGGALAAIVVSKDVLSVMQLLNTIKWTQISKIAANGGTGAATGGTVAAVPWYRKILQSDKLRYGAGITAFLGTLFKNALTEQGNDDILDKNGNLTELGAQMQQEGLLDENGHAKSLGPAAFDLSTGEWVEYNGPVKPRDNRLELTGEQAQAAEAYWDAYRNAAKNGWDEESSGLFDEAFDRLAELTGGEDSPLFTAIDGLTEDLKDSVPDNAWTDIEDLGDTAYKILDAVTWQDDTGNGLKTEDVSGFKALPAEIEQKAMEGLLKGASRMRIDMDGYSVGKVVAPYVSQEIAAEMLGGK